MTTRFLSWIKISFLILGVVACSNARAQQAVSIIGFGGNYHVGPDNNSLAGLFSFSGTLASETSRGPIRMGIVFGANYASGLMTYQDDLYDITRIGAEMKIGPSIHFFRSGIFLPIVALYGVAAGDLIQSDDPPPGASVSQVALGYGYEIEAGMSLPFRRESRLRIMGAYRRQYDRYAKQNIAFDLISARVAISF
jgi:hypothetical protein